MRARRYGMCRGTGKGYVGIRLTQIPAGAKPQVMARTDAGVEVPALWYPETDGTDASRQHSSSLQGVLVVPLLQTERLVVEFKAGEPRSTDLSVCSINLNMSALKWASRLNYRLRTKLTQRLRVVDTLSKASIRLALCVPDGEQTIWRFVMEERGLAADASGAGDAPGTDDAAAKVDTPGEADALGLTFSLFDGKGAPYQGSPIVLEDQTIESREGITRRLTFSYRLPTDLQCFFVEARGEVGAKLLDFFSVGPGEYDLSVAQNFERIKNAADRQDYGRWLRAHQTTPEALAAQAQAGFSYQPLISIITPSYEPVLDYLKQMLASVRAQSYAAWELILVDSQPQTSGVEELLASLRDARIKHVTTQQNLGIVGNTNLGIAHATGDYIAFLDYDDLLAPNALYAYVEALNKHGQVSPGQVDPGRVDHEQIDPARVDHEQIDPARSDPARVGLIYCDEETFSETPGDGLPILKTDFNRDLLYCHNCVTHFLMVSKDALDLVGLSDDEVNGAQDYDLTLRVSETDLEIVHVAQVLYHWRMHADSSSGDNAESKPYAHDAGKLALTRHFERRRIAVEVADGPTPFTYRVRYALPEPHPLVDIIIPSKDHIDVLDPCVSSLLEKCTYDNYRITIVENNSVDDATFAYYQSLQQRSDKVQVIRWPHGFNYPQIINFGMAHTGGEYALLLNNDTEVLSPGFIEEMLGYLQRPEVGVVGAKLFFPDALTQHAGMLIGPFDTVVHVNQNLSAEQGGYLDRTVRPGNFSSVTGACQMVRRKTFDQVGGYSEEFAVGFNDADFCCKITQAGYLVVYTPYAQLIHREFTSRGREEGDPEKMQRWEQERARMRELWPSYFQQGDPYSNPNLERDSLYFALPG